VSALLRFEGVTLKRGGRLLFEDLDLELGNGDALQVTGPNGSGKSSLIRLAAGLLQAERGRVKRSKLALADDVLALDRELPLKRALSFWSGPVEHAIDALGLTHLCDVPVRLLSSGQAKRATLARVAASGAPLWLLDEPLNALDAEGADRLSGIIQAQLASGGAVVAASHQTLPGDWRPLELGR
jgi:heme exporter protein A